MLKISATSKFKKDLKTCQKRKFDFNLLYSVIDTLAVPEPLDEKHREHALKGNYTGHRECHITPDWLLIYRVTDRELILDRTGTHSDLFRK
jgi:addiction module toxin component, YafQ family/addiction module toxin, RelE/StbE family